MGVFKYEDTALSAEAHNASPLRARNGSFLLFHIGSGGGGESSRSSSGVATPVPDSHFLHASESPSGPWRPLPGFPSSHGCNNPAPMRHNNGTMYVGCSNGGFTVYRCDDPFAGGWTYVTTMAFPPQWSADAPAELKNEDPFLWMDARGRWHLLAHRYDYRDGWPANPNQTVPVLVSGHGFSLDGVHWRFNFAEQPYNATVSFANGTVQHFPRGSARTWCLMTSRGRRTSSMGRPRTGSPPAPPAHATGAMPA